MLHSKFCPSSLHEEVKFAQRSSVSQDGKVAEALGQGCETIYRHAV